MTKEALTAEEASHILRGYYPHLPPDPCLLCKSIHDKLVQIKAGGEKGEVQRMSEPELTAEQQARDMLERMGVEDSQSFSTGELVELANLIDAVSGFTRDDVKRLRLAGIALETDETLNAVDNADYVSACRSLADRIEVRLPKEGEHD